MGIFDFLGLGNPAKDSMKYLNNLQPMYHEAYQPYIDLGNRQLPGLENQYSQMMNNPGEFYSNLGKDFQASPGYNFALQQALQGSNNAAAAGGMLGTPAHQQQNTQLASDIGNQEFYNYISQILGINQAGTQGAQGFANQGYGASTALAGNLGNLGLNQANLQFGGNQAQNNAIGGFLGMLGSAATGVPMFNKPQTPVGLQRGQGFGAGTPTTRGTFSG